MRAADTAVPGVAFQKKEGGRRPPPAVDPWSKRMEAARSSTFNKCPYEAALSAVLKDAKWVISIASQHFQAKLKKRDWTTPAVDASGPEKTEYIGDYDRLESIDSMAIITTEPNGVV